MNKTDRKIEPHGGVPGIYERYPCRQSVYRLLDYFHSSEEQPTDRTRRCVELMSKCIEVGDEYLVSDHAFARVWYMAAIYIDIDTGHGSHASNSWADFWVGSPKQIVTDTVQNCLITKFHLCLNILPPYRDLLQEEVYYYTLPSALIQKLHDLNSAGKSIADDSLYFNLMFCRPLDKSDCKVLKQTYQSMNPQEANLYRNIFEGTGHPEHYKSYSELHGTVGIHINDMEKRPFNEKQYMNAINVLSGQSEENYLNELSALNDCLTYQLWCNFVTPGYMHLIRRLNADLADLNVMVKNSMWQDTFNKNVDKLKAYYAKRSTYIPTNTEEQQLLQNLSVQQSWLNGSVPTASLWERAKKSYQETGDLDTLIKEADFLSKKSTDASDMRDTVFGLVFAAFEKDHDLDLLINRCNITLFQRDGAKQITDKIYPYILQDLQKNQDIRLFIKRSTKAPLYVKYCALRYKGGTKEGDEFLATILSDIRQYTFNQLTQEYKTSGRFDRIHKFFQWLHTVGQQEIASKTAFNLIEFLAEYPNEDPIMAFRSVQGCTQLTDYMWDTFYHEYLQDHDIDKLAANNQQIDYSFGGAWQEHQNLISSAYRSQFLDTLDLSLIPKIFPGNQPISMSELCALITELNNQENDRADKITKALISDVYSLRARSYAHSADYFVSGGQFLQQYIQNYQQNYEKPTSSTSLNHFLEDASCLAAGIRGRNLDAAYNCCVKGAQYGDPECISELNKTLARAAEAKIGIPDPKTEVDTPLAKYAAPQN